MQAFAVEITTRGYSVSDENGRGCPPGFRVSKQSATPSARATRRLLLSNEVATVHVQAALRTESDPVVNQKLVASTKAELGLRESPRLHSHDQTWRTLRSPFANLVFAKDEVSITRIEDSVCQ